ncbi:MAG: hypothetical protein WC494_02620 [Candidatus Pacearchaeota archaeon]
MKELIKKVKEKKQFSLIQDSIIEKSLIISKGDVKESRALLRKYFGLFLTNKVLKPKDILDWKTILKSHKSSSKRDYEKLYQNIFSDKETFQSIIDLGCGVNGFSIKELKNFVNADYIGVEAMGQVVDLTNLFFNKFCKGYNAHAVWLDLFQLDKIKEVIQNSKEPRAIFMFQVIDALESFNKNFSKEFLKGISQVLSKEDLFVLSFSTKSLSGKKSFDVKRKWITDFLRENFKIEKDFEVFDERFILFRKK